MSDDEEEERPRRADLAEDRTHMAEDRTLLANERTFSGWARTAMAAIGIGVGFHALFRTMEPVWVPKAIATLFILLGMLLIVFAERRACAIKARLERHKIARLGSINLRLMAAAICTGGGGLIAALWLLN
jgi:putative membrane protein